MKGQQFDPTGPACPHLLREHRALPAFLMSSPAFPETRGPARGDVNALPHPQPPPPLCILFSPPTGKLTLAYVNTQLKNHRFCEISDFLLSPVFAHGQRAGMRLRRTLRGAVKTNVRAGFVG